MNYLETTVEEIEQMQVSTKNLTHLGIVVGVFDELGIGEIIEEEIPKEREHKIPYSTAVKALVLNGLGFVERRLYIFPSYFSDLPTERLLGEGVTPEDLNEDTIGRTLDRIYKYGPTELFSKIAFKVMKKLGIKTHLLHADTTSFSVHGDYEGEDGSNAFEITFGYPKDKRWDLKQFVLSMVTNQYGMPFLRRYIVVMNQTKK